ncbi:MAG: hypothetical protein IJ193_08760 [Bacilli bacterium]|nr:hypothetical protein [Bacilli bacterium]
MEERFLILEEQPSSVDDLLKTMEKQRQAERMHSIMSIIFGIIVIIALIIKFRKTDKKTGIKGSGSLKFLKGWLYYVIAASLALTFLYDIGADWHVQLIILTIPIGAMLSCEAYGFIEVIEKFIVGAFLGGCLLLLLQVLRLFGVTDMVLVIRIVSTLLNIWAFIVVKDDSFYMWKNDAAVQSEIEYNLAHQKEEENTDLFDGDVEVKKDWLGEKGYYKNGKKIATEKKDLLGNTYIENNKHEKILTKEKNFWGDDNYKDKNGKIKYKEDTDIFGDHTIRDSQGKKISKSDSFLDSLRGSRKYKKK